MASSLGASCPSRISYSRARTSEQFPGGNLEDTQSEIIQRGLIYETAELVCVQETPIRVGERRSPGCAATVGVKCKEDGLAPAGVRVTLSTM